MALIGWQTLLADLSLILFMVTAAAMSASTGHVARAGSAAGVAPCRPCDPALGEPLALWRAGGSQTLRHWLASEQPDLRQQLTITAHYRQGGEAWAVAAVQALISEAGAMGGDARVIVAPASGDDSADIVASLAYDRAPGIPDAAMAQGLRNGIGHPSARNPP